MNSVDHVPNPSKSEIKSVFLLSKMENEIYRAEMKNKYVISTWLGRATLEIVARSRKYKIWMRKKGMALPRKCARWRLATLYSSSEFCLF